MTCVGRWFSFVALALASTLLVGILASPGRVAGQAPWPTPPPAPTGRITTFIPRALVTPVPPAPRPGSFSVVLDPIYPGEIPRRPPLPALDLNSEGLMVQVPAGAFWKTVQLAYAPVGEADLPAPLEGKILLRAFRLVVYDVRGQPLTEAPARAVRVKLFPTGSDIAAAGGKEWLLALRYSPERQRWEPLVTSVSADGSTLDLRLLEFGVLALVADPPPVGSGRPRLGGD